MGAHLGADLAAARAYWTHTSSHTSSHSRSSHTSSLSRSCSSSSFSSSTSSSSSFNALNTTIERRPRRDTQTAFRRASIVSLDKTSTTTIATTSVKSTTQLKRYIDEDGYKWINDYILLKTIGRGTYGKVKLGLHSKDGTRVAVKICNKFLLSKKKKGGLGSASLLEDVRREIAIMKNLDHPNVVRLYEVIDDPTNDKLYLVIEYVPGGALMGDVIRCNPMSEARARRYFRDVVAGLEYLHAVGVIHRDVKPQNLLLDSLDSVKIADFNVSFAFASASQDQMRTQGSPAFLAPEIVSEDAPPLDPAVDIWALGVTLYFLTIGSLPFMAGSEFAIYDKIRNKDPPFAEASASAGVALSDDLLHLLKGLLAKSPADRLTIPDIKTHPWVTVSGDLPMDSLTLTSVEPTERDLAQAFYESSATPVSPGLGGGDDDSLQGLSTEARLRLMSHLSHTDRLLR